MDDTVPVIESGEQLHTLIKELRQVSERVEVGVSEVAPRFTFL